ncbi:MAG: glycosyl hydrolase [Candidatus Aeolococcus gillhamiae]|uniref:Glycosyl hydrolase n=1 Tax=Candidatus Aeolococcus gillhamiae TaxID=3127015 RepID=A0A2W6A9Z6_9BACT|nr:MAG: glycosyl hydrolase [Candidatus Dormibacter sp. RRmetagenome_bin12]
MTLMGQGAGAAGDRVFRRMLAHPSLYDAFHFSQLRDGGMLARIADRTAVGRLRQRLEEEISRFGPELVVPVFPTGAVAAAQIEAAGGAFKTVAVITDAMVHHLWVRPPTDMYLVISAAAAESVRRYWPEAVVEVVVAPVRPGFNEPAPRDEARRALGIPPGATCALLMSGGWGIGPLDKIAAAVAQAGHWVLAVAGSNTKTEAKLEAMSREQRKVIPFGYTDRVPELMSAADVVVTSSGDTCREARMIGRPLVLLDVVPGHGRENLQYELELGGSTVCQPTPDSVARAVTALLADPRRRQVLRPPSPGAAEAQWRAVLQRLGFDLDG